MTEGTGPPTKENRPRGLPPLLAGVPERVLRPYRRPGGPAVGPPCRPTWAARFQSPPLPDGGSEGPLTGPSRGRLPLAGGRPLLLSGTNRSRIVLCRRYHK